MEQVRHPSLRSGMGVGINGYQSIKDTMITTTFSYDNCISTYSLVVDRTLTTRAQRWLSSRGVMYRIRFDRNNKEAVDKLLLYVTY